MIDLKAKNTLKYNVNGKCLNIIKSMYNNIKSKIKTSEGTSQFFQCNTGVRQGENLSPMLFSLYLNDLESFLMQKNIEGIECLNRDDELFMYFKLYIILYADDTVIFFRSNNSYLDQRVQLKLDSYSFKE